MKINLTNKIAFLISLGLVILIFCSIGIWPFVGPNSPLVLDMNGQYVYFFANLRSILLREKSIVYSWSRSLGGEFLGMYAYYLASPLSWLVVLFPADMIIDAIWLMLVLKIGFCGLTMSIFLQNKYPSNINQVVIFSALYAFCGFNLAYMSNIMWLDAVMWLPLLIMGLDCLLAMGEGILYTFMLALIILSNYYIGFMVCIFVFFYTLYYYIAIWNPDSTKQNSGIHAFAVPALRVFLYSLVAVAMSAIVLFPAYYSLQFGKISSEYTPLHLHFHEILHNTIDVLSKLLFGHPDTIQPTGIPFVYSGTLTLITLPLYFVSPRIKRREKIGAGFIILTLLVSMVIPSIDILWHGGQTPNWMNARYSFLFSFVLIFFAYQGFSEVTRVKKSCYIISGAGLLLLLALVWFQGYGYRYEYISRKGYNYNILLVYVNVILVVLYLVLIVLYGRGIKSNNRNIIKCLGKKEKIVCGLLGFLVFFEIYVSGIIQNASLALDVGYASRASYVDFLHQTQPVVDFVNEYDQSFYRVEKSFNRMVNDNMSFGLRGVSGSTSTYNEGVTTFLGNLGYRTVPYASWYQGGNPVSDSLLGIKYVIDDDNNVSSNHYLSIYKNGNTNRFVYKNPYALSVAYCVDQKILSMEENQFVSPFEYINSLTSAMSGRVVNLFYPIESTLIDDPEDLQYSVEEYAVEIGSNYRYATYNIEGANQDIYVYVPAYLENEMVIYINGERRQLLTTPDYAANINYLGRFWSGKKYEVTIATHREDFSDNISKDLFYTLDTDLFETVIDELKEHQLVLSAESRETKLHGVVTVTEKKPVLFTSIPYDKNWHIKVDGIETEPYIHEVTKKQFIYHEHDNQYVEENVICNEPLLGTVIALELEPGEHEVLFEYRSKQLLEGAMISGTGLLAFAVLCVIEKKYLKGKHVRQNI